MNYRESPPVTAKGRRVWLFMSLLLPALASKVSSQASTYRTPSGAPPTPPCPTEESQPYLRFLGPPPLRFQDVAPPPDLSARPPPGAPPKPNEKIAGSETEARAAAVAAPPTAPAPAQPAPKPSSASPQTAASPSPAIAPLLPDDAQPKVRPDDFLPYFQYPGAPGVPAPSAPGALPPSSATYNQQ